MKFFQELSKTGRVAVVICVAVIIITAMVLDALTEFELGPYAHLVLAVIAGGGGGIALAGGPSRGRGSAAALLIAVALGTSACAGAQRPGAACETERVIVDSLGAGLHAADAVVGDRGGEHYGTARTATLGALELGDAAVDACELLRDGAGWQAWVALALEAAGSLAAAIDGAGPEDIAEPVPPELEHAIGLLEEEARR